MPSRPCRKDRDFGFSQYTVTLGGFLLALWLAGCARQPPPQIKPGPWLIVDAEANRALAGQTIYYQGPAPPELQRRVPLRARAEPGVALVETVISTDGKVARARVLKAPKVEGLPEALVASLREWRFRPALLRGRPVAVYYTLTLKTS
jgi:TonB family protein